MRLFLFLHLHGYETPASPQKCDAKKLRGGPFRGDAGAHENVNR